MRAGTKDYSAYLSVTDALAFRRSLGTEAEIIEYMHDLAVRGGELLSRAWRTRMIPASVTAAMVNVELPCGGPTTEPCPPNFAVALYNKYRFYVPIIELPSGAPANETTSWMRISAQVYTEISDFELVRDAVVTEIGGE